MRNNERRTKDDIRTGILKALLEAENNAIDLKRTHIQHKCNINYMVAVEYTDQLVSDELIKRDTRGIYTLTEIGREAANQAELNEHDRVEIIKIAREIAETQSTCREYECHFCNGPIPEHDNNCMWMKLRELFDIGE